MFELVTRLYMSSVISMYLFDFKAETSFLFAKPSLMFAGKNSGFKVLMIYALNNKSKYEKHDYIKKELSIQSSILFDLRQVLFQ